MRKVSEGGLVVQASCKYTITSHRLLMISRFSFARSNLEVKLLRRAAGTRLEEREN